MSVPIARSDGPINLGIALLLDDGSVRIPRAGIIRTKVNDLCFDGGIYSVEPGKVIASTTQAQTYVFRFEKGRWTIESKVRSGIARFVLPLISLSLVTLACVVVNWALS